MVCYKEGQFYVSGMEVAAATVINDVGLGCWYAPTDCVSWALELYFDHTYFDHISMSDESRSTRALLEGRMGRLDRWATHALWKYDHHDGRRNGATHAPWHHDVMVIMLTIRVMIMVMMKMIVAAMVMSMIDLVTGDSAQR